MSISISPPIRYLHCAGDIELPIRSPLDERTREGDDHRARLFLRFLTDRGDKRAMEVIWGNCLKPGDYKYIGRRSLNRFVQLTSTTPAKLFGLFPRKGTIAVGSDADIMVFDPEERWTIRAASHHSRVDFSLFERRDVTAGSRRSFCAAV